MKLLRLSTLIAASLSLVFATGCSSSEFGASKGDGPSVGAQKAANEGEKTEEEESSDKNDSNKDADSDNDSNSKLDEKDDAEAADYQADESTKGCQLPADQRAKFTAKGTQLGFALGDWGSSGSAEVKLTNLSLTDCSWFQKFKDSDAIYIVKYDEKGAGLTEGQVVQSYAEPFNGKTAQDFAKCLQAAAAAGMTCAKVGDIK